MNQTLERWGRQIRACRKTAGLTVDELATQVGVHRSNVVRWESGKTEPRREHKARLATIFNLDVADLFPIVPVPESEVLS